MQLTLRLQGTGLLGFDAPAATAVLAALRRQSAELRQLMGDLQEVTHFACAVPRRQGLGCRLSPRQLADGEPACMELRRGDETVPQVQCLARNDRTQGMPHRNARRGV